MGIYNTTTAAIYFDGAKQGEVSKSALTDNSLSLAIGKHLNSNTYLNGTIDEVRIYNRSLSAAEIAEHYQAGKARLDYQDLRFTWLNSTSNAEQNNTLCQGITAEQAKTGYNITGCAGNITPISLYAVLETSDPTLTTPRLRSWNVTWGESTPPQVSFISPTPSNASYLPNNWTYINVSLAEQNNDTVKLSWNGTNETLSCAGTAPDWVCGVNKTGLSDGAYTYYAWANDTSGNANQTETRTLTIDTIPPIELTACADLNVANMNYILASNVSSSGTCFNIMADNITLDGQGVFGELFAIICRLRHQQQRRL